MVLTHNTMLYKVSVCHKLLSLVFNIMLGVKLFKYRGKGFFFIVDFSLKIIANVEKFN